MNPDLFIYLCQGLINNYFVNLHKESINLHEIKMSEYFFSKIKLQIIHYRKTILQGNFFFSFLLQKIGLEINNSLNKYIIGQQY